jgi:integration host factor subunit beta
MVRSELIDRLAAQYPDRLRRELTKVVDTVYGEIAASLVRGDRVELRGFGAFSTVVRDARKGRNPQTGETVAVSETRAIRFKPGKGIHARLNPESTP